MKKGTFFEKAVTALSNVYSENASEAAKEYRQRRRRRPLVPKTENKKQTQS